MENRKDIILTGKAKEIAEIIDNFADGTNSANILNNHTRICNV